MYKYNIIVRLRKYKPSIGISCLNVEGGEILKEETRGLLKNVVINL